MAAQTRGKGVASGFGREYGGPPTCRPGDITFVSSGRLILCLQVCAEAPSALTVCGPWAQDQRLRLRNWMPDPEALIGSWPITSIDSYRARIQVMIRRP
jgi:hypothetical protein